MLMMAAAMAASSALMATACKKQHWMPCGLVDAGAILLNKEGRRFTREDDTMVALCLALRKQTDETCHLLFDQRVADAFNKWPSVVGSFPGISPVSRIGGWCLVDDLVHCQAVAKAETIAGLAAATGIDAAGLRDTVKNWNRSCVATSDPDFRRLTFGHKDARTIGAGIRVPPFYCHGPLKAIVTPADTSLMINNHLQVLDVFGRIIPRLFAGGNMGHGNLLLSNTGHGMNMAWAFTSGRLGGKAAAAEKPRGLGT